MSDVWPSRVGIDRKQRRPLHNLVELSRIESGQRQREILRYKIMQLLLQFFEIPGCVKCETIIGKAISLFLSIRQMGKNDDGYFGANLCELRQGLQAAHFGQHQIEHDHIEIGVFVDRFEGHDSAPRLKHDCVRSVLPKQGRDPFSQHWMVINDQHFHGYYYDAKATSTARG